MAFFVCSLVFLYLSLILFTLLWKQSPVSFGQSSYPSGSCYSINAFNYVETSQRLSTPCWPSAISRCLRISHTPPDSVILLLNLRRVRSSHLLLIVFISIVFIEKDFHKLIEKTFFHRFRKYVGYHFIRSAIDVIYYFSLDPLMCSCKHSLKMLGTLSTIWYR